MDDFDKLQRMAIDIPKLNKTFDDIKEELVATTSSLTKMSSNQDVLLILQEKVVMTAGIGCHAKIFDYLNKKEIPTIFGIPLSLTWCCITSISCGAGVVLGVIYYHIYKLYGT